jgi:hypothetical protein
MWRKPNFPYISIYNAYSKMPPKRTRYTDFADKIRPSEAYRSEPMVCEAS